MGLCNCSMSCCALLYVHSSFAIILMGKRELDALLSLSSWCLVIVVPLPWFCLQFVIVAFPDHNHYFRRSVGPDLGPNCLQGSAADDTILCWQAKS